LDWLVEHALWLATMGVLILGSAFFSSSEAALFYLNRRQRRRLASGNRAQRLAARLLAQPDRLLTAVLFWNLVINLAYFTLASILSISLESAGRPAEAGVMALGSLVTLIVFSEMLPKSLAVLRPEALAMLAAPALATAVRLLDPVLPVLRTANLVSRRLLWPTFRPEPYLQVRDLERAVQLSTGDVTLLDQERVVLESIVLLSELRTDELMRPRTQVLVFRPPVRLADLQGQLTPSGYLLVTEPESDEVTGAIALRELCSIPEEHLENYAEPVVYVPWCTTVAEALQTMQRRNRRVSAVVNEYGETIGILTLDDILETIFGSEPSRSERLLRRPAIRKVDSRRWEVNGITSLRRLARHFGVPRPPSKSVTVDGAVQETLERLPQVGDVCRFGPFEFKVLEATPRGQLLVELTLAEQSEEAT